MGTVPGTMPLYGVKCINHIIVAGEILDYEESIVVVEADGIDGARQAATRYAIGAQTSYLNEDGETVEWVFHATDGQVHELVEPPQPPFEAFSKLHTFYWQRDRRR